MPGVLVMYLIRFCFAYLFFFIAVIILQLIPSIDFFFLKKSSENSIKSREAVSDDALSGNSNTKAAA
jgi:hypothetical protein